MAQSHYICGICGGTFNSVFKLKNPLCYACASYKNKQQRHAQAYGAYRQQQVPNYSSSKFQHQAYSGQSTMKQTKISIWWDNTASCYKCVFPYNEGFVALLKSQIPASDRAWHSDTKQWFFEEKYFDAIKMACTQIFGPNSCSFVPKSASSNNQNSGFNSNTGQSNSNINRTKLGTSDLALQFLLSMPYSVMKKAVRLAAHELHPDKAIKTGNMIQDNQEQEKMTEKMAELNSKWDLVEKEIYKQ